ncbi:MAG: VWA domain-containing protein [Planctomycetes bacterium]|nr:VWA domain-containing protein [Planctomycetota bacterium]
MATNKQTEAAGEAREEIMRGEIENLQEAMSKSRAAKSLRIDISHDSTGSMSSVIENTKNTTATLTRLLPKLLREVEIGLIAYRDGQLSEIPILPVKQPKDDGGASMMQLNAMLGQLQAIGGVANIEQSIRASMLRMDAMPGSPRECLVVIGDMGTEEASPGNPAVADQLIADVKAWCGRPGKNRRVLALYTGGSGNSPDSFFQRLGSVNTESMFSTNPSQMFELILSAAFAPKELTP